LREYNVVKRKQQKRGATDYSKTIDDNEMKDVLYELQYLRRQLMQMNDEQKQHTMRFVWNDSAFTQAYEMGDWIILDNVNCCRYVFVCLFIL
jgi:hypothetical protein